MLGLPADFKSGVVFSTYATLVSTVQKGGECGSLYGHHISTLEMKIWIDASPVTG